MDPAFDALIEPGLVFKTIMDGFGTSEGPLWVGGRDGFLLVSDVARNLIRRWSAREGESEFLRPSGYAGPPTPMLREGGSNGLIIARGGIVAADSGNRGIARIDLRTGRKTMLCSRFEGRRFNSPNDLVLGPDGSIYFTDPPYGLAGGANSPYREIDFNGVYRLAPDNTITVLDRIGTPNGIGLSPDGKTLYSTDWGKGWVAWTLDGRGGASDRRLFVDTAATDLSGGDGFKMDAAGNMWTSSREGLSVFNPRGRLLGQIGFNGRSSNCEIGADGFLYVCVRNTVMRAPVKTEKLVFGARRART